MRILRRPQLLVRLLVGCLLAGTASCGDGAPDGQRQSTVPAGDYDTYSGGPPGGVLVALVGSAVVSQAATTRATSRLKIASVAARTKTDFAPHAFVGTVWCVVSPSVIG